MMGSADVYGDGHRASVQYDSYGMKGMEWMAPQRYVMTIKLISFRIK